MPLWLQWQEIEGVGAEGRKQSEMGRGCMWETRIDCGREKGNLLLTAENGDNSKRHKGKKAIISLPQIATVHLLLYAHLESKYIL